MTNECATFRSIMSNAEKNLNELCEFWNIYERQRFFINAIGIYDKLFVDSIGLEKHIKPFYDRIIRYSYPVFIRLFYDPEFENLPGIVLKPLDDHHKTLFSKLVYSCGIIGWMQSLIDDVNAGYVTYASLFNHVRIKFREKYHWNEYLEKEYLTWYSETIAQLQQDEYEKLNAKLSEILDKLSRSVFVWRDHFMGYSNDIETEVYFNELAYLDAKQTVEWDFFPSECLFNNVCYFDIVQAIIDFSGYSIKHLYCANILNNLHPELLIENLLNCIFTEADLVHLIASNQEIDEKNARTILDMLSLNPNNKDYYNHTNASCAPFIKVSRQQYARSIRGFLDEPFAFALFKLRESFPKDWDRNVNVRETTFREHLYLLFNNERFVCVPHNVLIESDGHVRTDIDAAVIDKITGEIALFQLKWQDPSDYSSFTLKSKRNNYNEKTEKWINIVENWLKNCTEAELASKMGITKKYIQKDNILIFVLGRHHGNYSGQSKPTSKCAWVQWYQLLQTISYLNQRKELSIRRIYDYLIQTNPFNRKIIEPMNTFVYGKYRIHYGGGKIR